MSGNSEGNTNNSEGNNQPNFEELQKKLDALTKELDSTTKSKERILEESKKYKEGYQTFKQQQDELANEKAKLEEDRLIKEGQFKTLLEQREAQLKEMASKLQSVEGEVSARDKAIMDFKKAGVFESKLGGKIKHQSYWEHVNLDDIIINEDKSVDEYSLEKAIKDFTENHKALIDYGNNANLPNGAGARGAGSLSYDQWQKLPLDEKRKRMKDVKK